MAVANRWFGVAFACVGLGACAASTTPVLSVAAYDLECEDVELSRIDDEHYAASGCGRGAVYVQSCDGEGCRWARMRHGHEVDVAAAQAPMTGVPQPRLVIPAPPPEQRQVQPAPPPGSREIIPAPPPQSTSGGEAPGVVPTGGQVQPDELSAPYQAEVPAVPAAQRVQYTPPEPLYEERPPPPSITYVWVGGYWWSNDWGWTWVPGYWTPPRHGFVWYGGGWYWNASWWWYSPGGWCYPGSHVVVYQPAPRPHRVVTVRTIRPHSVVRGTAVASAPRSPVHSQPVRSSVSPSNFRPAGSPLLHYPAPSSARTHLAGSQVQSGSFAQPSAAAGARASSSSITPSSNGFGRLVRPNETVAPRSSHSSSSSSSNRLDRGGSSVHVDRGSSLHGSSSGSSSVSRSRAPTTVSPSRGGFSGRPPPSSSHSSPGGSSHQLRPRR